MSNIHRVFHRITSFQVYKSQTTLLQKVTFPVLNISRAWILLVLLSVAALTACEDNDDDLGSDGGGIQQIDVCVPLTDGVLENVIPVAAGAPAQPGPPVWWDGGNGPIDDPRWEGALSIGHINDAAQMRALRYVDGMQKYLVLSWEVKSDFGANTIGADYMYVGFWDPATNSGNIIRITRNATSSVTDGTFSVAFNAETFYRDSATGGEWRPILLLPPAPEWLQMDTFMDTKCVEPTCNRWAVRMRVPIGSESPVSNPSTGLPIPDTFRMWYEMYVDTFDQITHYKWPATATSVATLPFFTPPDPSLADQWHDVDASADTCAGGVSITADQISVNNGTSEISTIDPNVFHIRATNNTANPIPGNAIRARLRIANWGPNLYDSPQWDDINPSSPSCASAEGDITPVAAGDDFDLTCSWTLTQEQQCQYRPDVYTCTSMPQALSNKQCILAELSSITDVLFTRASTCLDVTFR